MLKQYLPLESRVDICKRLYILRRRFWTLTLNIMYIKYFIQVKSAGSTILCLVAPAVLYIPCYHYYTMRLQERIVLSFEYGDISNVIFSLNNLKIIIIKQLSCD